VRAYECYPPAALSPLQQRQQTQDALVAWLLAKAERQPVMAMWEDLHWAHPSTLELLSLFIEQARMARLLVCSDEPGAWRHACIPWDWSFPNAESCVHVIRPSRAHGGIHDVPGDHRPAVWVSDLYSAQQNHPTASWQVCVAQPRRDCRVAIEAGDAVLAPRMYAVLLRACAIHKRRDTLAASTLHQDRCDLQRCVHRASRLSPPTPTADGCRSALPKSRTTCFGCWTMQPFRPQIPPASMPSA
jgi:hypothetical protein